MSEAPAIEPEENAAAETDHGENGAPEVYLTGSKLYFLIFGITLAGFLLTLDISIVVTAIPVITAHFHSLKDVGWYGSAYLITKYVFTLQALTNSVSGLCRGLALTKRISCACQPSTGKIYQYYNTKYTFLTFVALFELGSLISGVAPSSKCLIIGRAVSGLGASGIMNGGLTIIASASPKHNRPRNLGFVFAFGMLGMVIGPLIGGVLTQDATWRWCFYINLPAGAVTVAILLLVEIPDNKEISTTKPALRDTIERLDPVGFLLFAPACVMLLLALQWGGTTHPWNSSTVIGLFVGFGATICVFCGWMWHRGNSGMIPLALIRQRIFYSSCIAMMCQTGSVVVFSYYLPIWFQTILGVTPIKSGGYYTATAGMVVIGGIVAGFTISKIGYYITFSLLGNTMAAIGGGLLTTLTPHSPVSKWIGYQILTGLGRGMALQQPMTAIQQILVPTQSRDPKDKSSQLNLSVGTAVLVFFQYFGGAVSIAIAETIFSNSLGPTLHHYAPRVNETLIVSVGAASTTGIRSVVSQQQLPGVLKAYNQTVTNTFILGAGISALAFCASLGMGFKSIKKKPEPTKTEEKV